MVVAYLVIASVLLACSRFAVAEAPDKAQPKHAIEAAIEGLG